MPCLDKTELKKGGKDKDNKSTTGKRKREVESGDAGNVKPEKEIQGKGVDEDDEDGMHQNTSYTITIMMRIFGKA